MLLELLVLSCDLEVALSYDDRYCNKATNSADNLIMMRFGEQTLAPGAILHSLYFINNNALIYYYILNNHHHIPILNNHLQKQNNHHQKKKQSSPYYINRLIPHSY